MTELKAVLWDMDGTLIDSEPVWQVEEQALMSAAGIDWPPEQASLYIGQAVANTAQGMIDRGLPMSLPEVLESLISNTSDRLRKELPWQPGAYRLLTSLAPLRTALVTMSDRRVAQALIDSLVAENQDERNIGELGGVPGHVFDAVITGDGVTRGKPDPEPYLRAVSELGLRPEECIAFEDSLPGVASATAAGVVTIGVEGSVALGGSDADEIVDTLEGISVDYLKRLHAVRSGR